MTVGVVGDVVVPTAPEHSHPGASEDADGVGLLTATALYASIGDIRTFKSGRHLASWLGLPPKECDRERIAWHGGSGRSAAGNTPITPVILRDHESDWRPARVAP